MTFHEPSISWCQNSADNSNKAGMMDRGMKQWITDYLDAQRAAHDSIPVAAVAEVIEILRQALKEDRQILVFGNGGSAANASHFMTDLGKGASDKTGK